MTKNFKFDTLEGAYVNFSVINVINSHKSEHIRISKEGMSLPNFTHTLQTKVQILKSRYEIQILKSRCFIGILNNNFYYSND